MSTLTRTRLRLAGDAANFDAPLDVLRRATPQFWRGNDAQFELAVFFNGALQDVSNLASLTLEIRPLGSGGAAPDPGFTPLMGATVTSFDNTTTLDSWNSGTKQHAVVTFTAAQSNIVAGPAWLSIFVITTDSPGRVITLCAGPVRVLEDGSGLATTPSPAGDTFYTAAQSDARFAPIGGGGGGGGSGSVTSVALSVPSFLSVAGSPITSAGTLAVSLANANANLVFAGPGSGSAAAPGFRALVAADLPAIAQAGVTGLTSALAALAPLASPAFTGTPTAPTPGGSDNSTNLATTAWVRGYTAPITNDGSGHYVFGSGSPYTIYSGYTAILTVNGGLVANSSLGEHRIINSFTTTDGDQPGYIGNVVSFQATCSYINSAVRFISSDNFEVGAVGFVNHNCAQAFVDTVFLQASWKLPIDGSSTTPAAPMPLMLLRGGSWNNDGVDHNGGITLAANWDLNIHTPFSADLTSTNEAMVHIPMTPTSSGSQINYGQAEIQVIGTPRIYDTSGTSNTHAAAQFTAINGAGNLAILASVGDNSSYHAYPANGMWVGGNGPGGVAVMATNSTGAISFFTGGDLSSNARLSIDSSGNLLFSNHVTSAPSVTLASGQYQITVYDNGSTPVLRVRYNNGSTVKVGDLTLS